MATPRSKFFQAAHISEYKNRLKPTLTDRNLTLLNLEDLLQYLYTTRLDIVSYGLRKSAVREHRKVQERTQNLDDIIRELAHRICTNIGKKYGQMAVKHTVKATSDFSRFDILVLIDADYETLDPKSKRSLMDQRFDKIRGFLVTELGECKSQPLVYSVNLICSTISGGGAFLMGAYLFCIKRTPSLPQLGLLELAGGYENTTGLCAYSKFGYIPNIVYLGDHCFNDTGNLPMSVDVARLTEDQILDVVRGTSKISQFDSAAREQTIFDMLYTHPLCNRTLFISDDEQDGVAFKYNRLYRLMYQVRTLSGYEADANYIPDPVIRIVDFDLNRKIRYYENKREETGKKLTIDQKTAVVGDVVNNKLDKKIAELTNLVNEIQETKANILDRKKRKLVREAESTNDPAKKRANFEQIRALDAQIAAINRFSGEDAPSPESVRSEAESLPFSPSSPTIETPVSEEDREAEMEHMYVMKLKGKAMYLKKKKAKKAAQKTARKLEAKRASAAKKTARRMPPKVPRHLSAKPASEKIPSAWV